MQYNSTSANTTIRQGTSKCITWMQKYLFIYPSQNKVNNTSMYLMGYIFSLCDKAEYNQLQNPTAENEHFFSIMKNAARISLEYHCKWKWQDYVYIQCEYKSTKQKIKHLLREENKVKEHKI